jgi:hypothetical protein
MNIQRVFFNIGVGATIAVGIFVLTASVLAVADHAGLSALRNTVEMIINALQGGRG